MNDAQIVMHKVAQALSECGVAWYVSGSMASSAHGIPRSTQDVDFVVALEPAHVEPFVRALETEFHVDAITIRRAINSQRSFNLIHLATMYKADLYVQKDEPFAQEQMRRRLQVMLPTPTGETAIWFCSAEDIVLQKLLWYQKGGGVSDQQWRDIANVLRAQDAQLDRPYLRQWAENLRLLDLLTRACNEAGITFTPVENA